MLTIGESEEKRGRAVLIDNGVYYVVGDDGVQRKL